MSETNLQRCATLLYGKRVADSTGLGQFLRMYAEQGRQKSLYIYLLKVSCRVIYAVSLPLYILAGMTW